MSLQAKRSPWTAGLTALPNIFLIVIIIIMLLISGIIVKSCRH